MTPITEHRRWLRAVADRCGEIVIGSTVHDERSGITLDPGTVATIIVSGWRWAIVDVGEYVRVPVESIARITRVVPPRAWRAAGGVA